MAVLGAALFWIGLVTFALIIGVLFYLFAFAPAFYLYHTSKGNVYSERVKRSTKPGDYTTIRHLGERDGSRRAWQGTIGWGHFISGVYLAIAIVVGVVVGAISLIVFLHEAAKLF